MPKKRSDTLGLATVLDIAVGAQVMPTYEINILDGLVNGAIGSVVHIINRLQNC